MRTIPLSDIAGATRVREALEYIDNDCERPLSAAQKRKMAIDEEMEMERAFEDADRCFYG